LKWAQTADGFIAPKTKNVQKAVWITNTFSRQLSHKWRTEEHAILVGTNTVLQDNPSLTARDWKGQNPIRVVLDKNNKLDKSFNVFNQDAQTLVISENEIDFNKPIANDICSLLHQKQIQSVIIEGGTKTLQTFIDEGLWDEARIFTGSDVMFKEGIKAPKFSGILVSETQLLNDSLKIYKYD